MRKILTVALAIVLCAPVLSARHNPYKFEVNVGWGGFPFLDAMNFSDATLWGVRHDVAIYYPTSISGLYSDYMGPTYCTGVISAEFNTQFKWWFALGAQVNFNGLWSNVLSSETDAKLGTADGLVLSVLPYARFTYLNKPIVKLYSAVGLGITWGYRNYDYTDKSVRSDGFVSSCYPAFQITPIGVTVGRRVYGLFEIGYGTVYMGCKAGIGYRF